MQWLASLALLLVQQVQQAQSEGIPGAVMGDLNGYTDPDKVEWKGAFHNGSFLNGKAYATLR